MQAQHTYCSPNTISAGFDKFPKTRFEIKRRLIVGSPTGDEGRRPAGTLTLNPGFTNK